MTSITVGNFRRKNVLPSGKYGPENNQIRKLHFPAGEYLFKVIGDKYLYVKYAKLILVQTRKSKLANSIFMTLDTFETTLRPLISDFY